MPIIERKSRARLRSRPESTIQSMEDMRSALLASHDDPDLWQAARPGIVRFLATRMKDVDHALRAAEVYHKRPEFLPMRPPAAVRD